MAKHFKNSNDNPVNAPKVDNAYNPMPVVNNTNAREARQAKSREAFGSTHGGKQPLTQKQFAMRVIFGILGVSIAIMVGLFAYGMYFVHSLNNSLGFDNEQIIKDLQDTLHDSSDDSAFYVALLGSDAREGDYTSRADVNMLMRVDMDSKTISLVSIPRDMQINFAGQGVCKINAAYAYNGPVGAVTALQDFAGVDISHYAEIHFDELVNLIDLLGGVEVNVPESFNADGHMIYSGLQTLSGEDALAFTRNRYQSVAGDFGRAQAQRIVVEAIINKVLNQSPLDMPSIITSVASCFSTDLTVEDIVDLALEFQGSDYSIYSAICPSYAFNENGVSYVGVMYDEWHSMMCYVDAGMDPLSTEAIPQEQLNDKKLGSASNGASTRDYESAVANSGLTTDAVVSVD